MIPVSLPVDVTSKLSTKNFVSKRIKMKNNARKIELRKIPMKILTKIILPTIAPKLSYSKASTKRL